MEARKRHLAQMRNLKRAINETKSPFLKRDYTKAYKRMERELHEFDFHRRRVMISEAEQT